MNKAGYKTGYFGKYMNGYDRATYVPPGWDRWVAADRAPDRMVVSDNGKAVDLQPRYETFDLAMKDYSLDFLKNNVKSPTAVPHDGLVLGTAQTESGRAKYEKRYAKRFSGAKWPRTPNFDERDRSDKPRRVRSLPGVSSAKEKKIDKIAQGAAAQPAHRGRRGGGLRPRAVEGKELSDTYIFYFTDNGWHMGSHALAQGKNTPYTEDVEFPLIVRGPRVEPGTTDRSLVSNTDIAPTFADVANASPTSSVDGRSILPLLAWGRKRAVEGCPADRGQE